MDDLTSYQCIPLQSKKSFSVRVPGSKSMTNRALLLGALAEATDDDGDGKGSRSVLRNLLLSDDSRAFLNCLATLGYHYSLDEAEHWIAIQGDRRIPRNQADIYVNSAGTAARFLSAMLAFGAVQEGGMYRVDGSEQMRRRPMHQLLDACVSIGAKITYERNEGNLPITIEGKAGEETKENSPITISLNIDESSQFLSALLMNAVLLNRDLTINLTGKRTAKAYVEITTQMMKEFGVLVERLSERSYRVKAGQRYQIREYEVEPDLSAACYFYAMAAITGREAVVQGVHPTTCQGDYHFLEILCQMGCEMWDTEEGVHVKGPLDGRLEGISVDLSNCSDQTMTLAAIAPFAKGTVRIENIGHIRMQESDRIHAIHEEITRMGIVCEEGEDYLVIEPGEPKAVTIETYEDHRMAMAFAVTGLRVPGMRIANPLCCAKTFQEYFETLDELCEAR